MALTNEDLQAIASLMDEKLNPIYERLDKIESKLGMVEDRLDKIESKLGMVEGKLNKIDSRLDNLYGKHAEIKRELHKISRQIFDTYNISLDVLAQSAEANGLIDT